MQWLLLPVLGKFSPFLFLLQTPLLRSKGGKPLPEIAVFLAVAAVYTIYMGVRALAAGAEAEEPIAENLPLIIVPALVLWCARAPLRLDLGWVFRGTVGLLIAIFCLASYEKWALNVLRPELLLGNPLNLAPLLLVPCMLMTIRDLAPCERWRWAGLIGFCLGGYVIGGLAQSRGVFLVFAGLVVIRLAFEVWSPAPIRERVKTCTVIIAAMGLVVASLAFNPSVSTRYVVAAQSLSQSSAPSSSEPAPVKGWSTGLRIEMLVEGWRKFEERPVLGHGPQHRFTSVFPRDSSFPLRASHLHNDFLTHAVGGGLIGALLLCIVLAMPAVTGFARAAGLPRRMAHNRRQIGALASAAFFGVAAVNNVFFVSISTYTTTLSLVMVLLIQAALRETAPAAGTAGPIAQRDRNL